VISEIGADVTEFFPGDAHLASWTGLCPGNHESAGKRRSGKRRKGNPHLQSILAGCAWSAVRQDGYLKSLYHRHVMKWGGYRSQAAKKKAIVVVAHALVVIIWHILATGKPYHELGADYFTRRLDPNGKPAASSPGSKRSATPSLSSQPPDRSSLADPCPPHRPGSLPPAQLRTIHVSVRGG
jgi:Transposase IS116/IS110/IS902 family